MGHVHWTLHELIPIILTIQRESKTVRQTIKLVVFTRYPFSLYVTLIQRKKKIGEDKKNRYRVWLSILKLLYYNRSPTFLNVLVLSLSEESGFVSSNSYYIGYCINRWPNRMSVFVNNYCFDVINKPLKTRKHILSTIKNFDCRCILSF